MDKLSEKEAAFLAAARREAVERGAPVAKNVPAGAAVPPPSPVAPEKPKPSAAERLALLMAEERAETERRKRKMRRTGIIASSAILAIFALWVLRAARKR